MIIKDVIVSNGNARLVTESGESVFELGDIPEGRLRGIIGMEFNCGEDFLKLKDFLEFNSYRELENAVLECAPFPFKLINSNANQVPRPMSLILEKASGIVRFYAVSFSVNDFQKGLEANNQILRMMQGRMRKYRTLNLGDELILNLLKECVDEVNIHIGFKVQIGIDCDSCFNDVRELAKLVERYDICYVEDPFPDLLSCREFTKRVRHRAFVCSELDRSNYGEFLRKNIYSCALVSSECVADLVSRMGFFWKNSFGLVCDCGLADISVGFGIPVMKVGKGDAARILEIKDEIRRASEPK